MFGGREEDYMPLHNYLDATKESFCDYRHRALRHHAEGIFEGERVFGVTIENSDGKKVPVRYVLEQHVLEDLGRIPNLADWLSCIQPEPWMARATPVKLAHGTRRAQS
jgi:hypothetical protein